MCTGRLSDMRRLRCVRHSPAGRGERRDTALSRADMNLKVVVFFRSYNLENDKTEK